MDFQKSLDETKEIGFVEEVSDAVAYVRGLPNSKPYELVYFESGEVGYVLSLGKEYIEVLLLSKHPMPAGTKVTRSNHTLEVSVGDHLLGKTINTFGREITGELMLTKKPSVRRGIERVPEGISARSRIDATLETGVAMVDLIVPLGKGQRELIIGDRKSGKTNFLLQTMYTQAKNGTICLYVAIGKKQLSIKKVEEFAQTYGIASNCIIVASTAEDPAGVIYLTPYTGMTIAEYFKDSGRDVLIILDDLTTHARFARQIGLLIKRFPGRNSYPADIFYSHARLLERAGKYTQGDTTRAITCLPVAETVQGDLSGFIQTNLMSMTDGHLYFDSDLFAKGRRPAIHPFLSVTRVGRQTQSRLRQTLNREILSFLSMHEKMQNFTHFGAEVSVTIANTLKMGEKIFGFFEQLSYAVLPINLQIFLFSLVWVDTWRERGISDMKADMQRISKLYESDSAFRDEISALIEKSDSFNKFLGELRGKPAEFYKKLGV